MSRAATSANGSARNASTGRPGAIQKQVSVFAQEMPDEPLTFTLGGIVQTEWRISPSATLDLGTIAGGATKTATFPIGFDSACRTSRERRVQYRNGSGARTYVCALPSFFAL